MGACPRGRGRAGRGPRAGPRGRRPGRQRVVRPCAGDRRRRHRARRAARRRSRRAPRARRGLRQPRRADRDRRGRPARGAGERVGRRLAPAAADRPGGERGRRADEGGDQRRRRRAPWRQPGGHRHPGRRPPLRALRRRRDRGGHGARIERLHDGLGRAGPRAGQRRLRAHAAGAARGLLPTARRGLGEHGDRDRRARLLRRAPGVRRPGRGGAAAAAVDLAHGGLRDARRARRRRANARRAEAPAVIIDSPRVLARDDRARAAQ